MEFQPSLFGGEGGRKAGFDSSLRSGEFLGSQQFSAVDPGRDARFAKREKNRERIVHNKNLSSPTRWSGEHSSTEDFGLQHHSGDYPNHIIDQWDFDRWEKMPTQLVPRNELYGSQGGGVSKARVHEIIRDPSSAVGDTRMGRELPWGVKQGDKTVLIQGHHRASAEMAKGALFLHAHVINSPEEAQDKLLQVEQNRVNHPPNPKLVENRKAVLAGYGGGHYEHHVDTSVGGLDEFGSYHEDSFHKTRPGTGITTDYAYGGEVGGSTTPPGQKQDWQKRAPYMRDRTPSEKTSGGSYDNANLRRSQLVTDRVTYHSEGYPVKVMKKDSRPGDTEQVDRRIRMRQMHPSVGEVTLNRMYPYKNPSSPDKTYQSKPIFPPKSS